MSERCAISVVGMRAEYMPVEKLCSESKKGLWQRLKELAATHVRYGSRRLTVLLRREGWPVNAKRIYRLYRGKGYQR